MNITVITLIVDPENGNYIAMSMGNYRIIGFSRESRLAAVGDLVSKTPGIVVDRVVHIEPADYDGTEKPEVKP